MVLNFYDVSAHWKKQIGGHRDWLMTNPWRNNSDCETDQTGCDDSPVENQYKPVETFSSLNLD